MTDNRTMIILTGLPASGKSRYAAEWLAEDASNRHRANYDDLRVEMFGSNWRFNRPDEQRMKSACLQAAREAVEAGKSVIVDNTNLTPGSRAPWIGLAHDLGVSHEIFEVSAPVEECVRRDHQRAKRVGRAVIERMALFNGFIDWSGYGRRFVIVDVDGTLANNDHRQHHLEGSKECSKCTDLTITHCEHCKGSGRVADKDWKSFLSAGAVAEDTPIQPIFDLVRSLAREFTILVVSGRGMEDNCGIITEDWLDQHWPLVGGLPRYRHLFMRQGGDHRPDYEVKQEILDLLPKDRIAYVIDDRDQVVDMWRRNGLTCLQCANGNF